MSSYDDSSSFFGDSSSYDDFNFVKRSLEGKYSFFLNHTDIKLKNMNLKFTN